MIQGNLCMCIYVCVCDVSLIAFINTHKLPPVSHAHKKLTLCVNKMHKKMQKIKNKRRYNNRFVS